MLTINTHRDPLADFLGFSPFIKARPSQSLAQRNFQPAVDVYETEPAHIVEVELAGVARDDIEIEVDKGVLTIRGERKSTRADESDLHHLTERVFGAFTRTFRLPEGVDAENIEADLDAGVLRLTLPKAEIARPRKIEVK